MVGHRAHFAALACQRAAVAAGHDVVLATSREVAESRRMALKTSNHLCGQYVYLDHTPRPPDRTPDSDGTTVRTLAGSGGQTKPGAGPRDDPRGGTDWANGLL